MAALLAHRSQYRTTMGIAGEEDLDDARRSTRSVPSGRSSKSSSAAHGRLGGLALGEAFRLLTELLNRSKSAPVVRGQHPVGPSSAGTTVRGAPQ